MNEMDIALICKALGDANRLKIVKMLSDGEKCGCKLLESFEITQPTLSHHMKILCECGLVETRKEGKWLHYSCLLYTFSEPTRRTPISYAVFCLKKKNNKKKKKNTCH